MRNDSLMFAENPSGDDVVSAINGLPWLQPVCYICNLTFCLYYIYGKYSAEYAWVAIFALMLVTEYFYQRWQRGRISKTLDKVLDQGGAPSRGVALALIELLFYRGLNDQQRWKVIEYVFRRNPKELMEHQETMLRFARRWLWRFWLHWRKDSPLHRLAADLAYHEGWLPAALQEKIKAKLKRIDIRLAR